MTTPTNVKGNTVYLSFTADINPQTTQSLIAGCAQYANAGAQCIYLLFSTPGGQIRDGISCYNVLRALPIKLITHNTGNVDSIGNVVFLAGEERYCSPNATFMFHGVGMPIFADTRLEQKQVEELRDSLRADTNKISAVIESRATFPNRETIDELFYQQSTKDAAFAKEHGLVHDIRDINIPPGSTVEQFVFEG